MRRNRSSCASLGSHAARLSDRMTWEETLLDNLLNFAATPKGLLLLQQTGAIDEGVSHMFSRFIKKLQVTPAASIIQLNQCKLVITAVLM